MSIVHGRPQFHYMAYGMNIASCIPCPELCPCEGIPDVTICYGAVPGSLRGASEKGGSYEVTSDHLLLSIEGVGRYLVSGGKEILIERAAEAGDLEVRLFLLGSALGGLLHQRGLLPLHGSAFEVDRGCLVILAHSGQGKSTLAGVFRKRGYRILADDVCVVSINGDGLPMILPGYPQLKLQIDAARKLGEEPESLPRIHPKLDKRGIQFQEEFCQKPLPLRRLYVLETNSSREFNLAPLKGIEKLTAIMENTYRFCFLDGLGTKAFHFKQCVAVAKHTPLNRVTRPSKGFLLEELAQLLEEDFLYQGHGQDLQKEQDDYCKN